jgi:hypothetical protein
MLHPLEFSMSKKDPKSAKSMTPQEAVGNLFHPKASGNTKKHPKARRNRGKKALNFSSQTPA